MWRMMIRLHKCRPLISHSTYWKYFCPECNGEVKESVHIDYFILFEMNYDLNKQNLKEKYKDYQKALHPDVLQGCGIDNQEFSKLLVEAYMTLSHDTSRAIYMVRDMQLGIDDKQAEDLKVSDFDFLEEQFERRMEVQMTDDQNKLQEILNRVMRDKHTFKQEIAQQLKARNNDSAIETVAKLKFIDKLEEDVRQKLNVN